MSYLNKKYLFFVFACIVSLQGFSLAVTWTSKGGNCRKEEIDFYSIVTGLKAGDSVIQHIWVFEHASTPTATIDTNYTPTDTILQKVFNNPTTVSNKNYVTIQVTTASGETAVFRKEIIIKESPVLNFGATSACVDSVTTFFNTSDTFGSSVTYRWVITGTSGNPKQFVTKTPPNQKFPVDVYDLKLRMTLNSTGCGDSINKPFYVFDNPRVNFLVNSVSCVGTNVKFEQRTSVFYGNNPDSFLWDFNDGSGVIPTNLDTISHKYTTAQSYNVKLIAITPGGCRGDTTIKISTVDRPTADFTNTKVCQFGVTNFKDASVNAAGTLKYNWNFGTGDIDSVKNPAYIFKRDTIFNVKLKVTSSNGCKDSISKPLTVIKTVSPKIFLDNNCITDTVDIKDITFQNPADTVVTRTWYFGDGDSSVNNKSTKHKYKTASTFDVTLKHITQGGCNTQSKEKVTIYPLPKPNFTFNSVCTGNKVLFNNTSSIPSTDTISLYIWNFGDPNANLQNPNTSTDTNSTHFYKAPSDTYKVLLTAVSTFGCKDTLSKRLKILQGPTTNFTNTTGCERSDISFTYTGNGSGVRWNFGDTTKLNDTSTNKNTKYNYSYGGAIGVQLVSIAANGCRDTINRIIAVNKLSKVYFSWTGTCTNGETQFQSLADTGEANPPSLTNFKWEIPPSTVYQGKTETSPIHTFLTAGTKKVKLTITTLAGCTSFLEQDVIIDPQPTADFTYSKNVCREEGLQFTNLSTNTVTEWSWNYNDGTPFDSIPSPRHTFGVNRDSEEVILTVMTAKGCSDTVSQFVKYKLSPKAIIDILAGDDEVCLSRPFVAQDLSEEFDGTFTPDRLWLMGDGNTQTVKTTDYFYTTHGKYDLQLIAIGANGCRDTSKVTQINILKPPIAIINHEAQLCANYPVVFFADSSLDADGGGFEWFFAGSTTPVFGNRVNFEFPGPGIYDVKLVAKNNIPSDNCSDTAMMQVEIKPTPLLGFTSDIVCEGFTTTFNNTSSIAPPATLSDVKFSWLFGDDFGGTSDSFSPTYLYNAAGSYEVKLNGVIDYGTYKCPAKPAYIDTIFVRANPIAEFRFDPGDKLDNINPVAQVIDMSTPDVNNWIWNYGDSTTDIGMSPDSHRFPIVPYDTGTYIVKLFVKNTFGCVDTAEHAMKIKQYLKPFIASAFSPNSDGLNDVWQPSMLGVRSFRLTIMNRWGSIVYTSDKYDMEKGWDGTFNGKKCPEGVYIYSIEASDYDNLVLYKFNGHITLLR